MPSSSLIKIGGHPNALVKKMPTSAHVLLAAALAAVPAMAFQPNPVAVSLRGARSSTCAAAPTRMSAEPASMSSEAEPYCMSRREFFKDVGVGATALTIGSLGFEVPQSYADGLPAVSAPAPSFSLPSNQGKNIGLEDIKGKWSVLYFYPGDFTSGCTIEAQNFEKGSGAIRGLGAEIYGVSVDGMYQ